MNIIIILLAILTLYTILKVFFTALSTSNRSNERKIYAISTGKKYNAYSNYQYNLVDRF